MYVGMFPRNAWKIHVHVIRRASTTITTLAFSTPGSSHALSKVCYALRAYRLGSSKALSSLGRPDRVWRWIPGGLGSRWRSSRGSACGGAEAGATVTAATMPARVTAFDIAQAGSMTQLVGQTIEQLKYGTMETKEFASQVLRSLTEMKSEVEVDEKKEKPVLAEEKKDSLSLDPAAFSGGFKDNIALIVDQLRPLSSHR